MHFWEVPRLYKRAILIYVSAIVVPAGVLLWLGVQSFDRQKQALATLTNETVSAHLEAKTAEIAKEAFEHRDLPIVLLSFQMENGQVIDPAFHAPPPRPMPPEFADATRQEFVLNRLDVALSTYRQLFNAHQHPSLALSGIARCLEQLGHHDEARTVWRRLAAEYPDDRDLENRPYGIVAAIAAADTAGLYEKIAAGHWKISGDQAEHFLSQLDPSRSTSYLNQFTYARDLAEQFRPLGSLRESEIYSSMAGERRVFYRADGPNQLSGFVVNQTWLDDVLKPQLKHDLGIADTTNQDLRVYGAAIALMLVILTAGIILLLRDISREARSNRLKSDFVSGVSHELKTPITLIRLYSETLLRGTAATTEERNNFCRIIMRESDRLGRMVDRVLTFSRVERGAQAYKFEEGDVAPVVERIVEDYFGYFELSGFRLERRLATSLPKVRFDAAALSQAIVNLMENALKYSGESRDITVSLKSNGRMVTFEVEDHGLGVPVEEQKRIFERFYRVPNGDGQGGYGLGLFLVQHIMTAHGGFAEVESQPGKGSTFRLSLPTVA